MVTNSDKKVYDGTPLTNSGITVGGKGLAENQKVADEVKANGSQTEIGQSKNTLNMRLEDVVILDTQSRLFRQQFLFRDSGGNQNVHHGQLHM